MSFFDFVAPVYEHIRPNAEKTFRMIRAAAVFKSTDIVVDLGGGTGAIAKFFVNKVQRMVVVDPSENMLEQCRKHTGLNCALGSAESIPLPDASANKIILVDTFHHIQGQQQAILEIRRVLKSGGAAILVEYDPSTIGGWLIAKFEMLLRMGSTFHSPENLTQLFAVCGFNVRVIDGGKEYCLVADKA